MQNQKNSMRFPSIIYKTPDALTFNSPEDEAIKSQAFKNCIKLFHKENGNTNFKIPHVGGTELNLLQLFKSVYIRGGSHQVSSRKLWSEVFYDLKI